MKKLHVQCEDFDYDVETAGDRFTGSTTTMTRGIQGWCNDFVGGVVVRITDTGNGLIVTLGDVDKGITLDYSEADELMMALLAHTKNTEPFYKGFTLQRRTVVCEVK